jgi:hypothetical protein
MRMGRAYDAGATVFARVTGVRFVSLAPLITLDYVAVRRPELGDGYMSRQVRYRVTALVLGGLLLGTPLLTNGTASAEQVEVGRQVVFGGGVLGLSCRSNPDTGSLTVPAESTVRVVNRTGHSARLQLGGAQKGTVPDDGSTEVRFRRGTTAVLLSPRCALGDESTPVLVTATPSPSATGLPNPTPTPPDDSAPPSTPSGSESPSVPVDGGSTLPDAVVPPTRPQRPGVTRPGAPRTPQRPRQAVTTAVPAMPQGGSETRVRARINRGTETVAPTFAGMPPGDHKTVVSGVPTMDLSSAAAPAPAAPTSPPPTVAVAEPVAAMEPMSKNGQIGLLALIAMVCVTGVSVGAIRAFVSQRASRATIA